MKIATLDDTITSVNVVEMQNKHKNVVDLHEFVETDYNGVSK